MKFTYISLILANDFRLIGLLNEKEPMFAVMVDNESNMRLSLKYTAQVAIQAKKG